MALRGLGVVEVLGAMPSVPSRTLSLQRGLSGFVVPKAAAARRMRGAAGPASA